MALYRLELHSLKQGTFQKWLRYKGKSGSQVKVPRLANHRDYVEDIMEFTRDRRGKLIV